MVKPTINQLKEEFAKYQYDFTMKFHLVGVRSRANVPNKFDDLVGVVKDNEVYWFSATTNAGRHWLVNMMNPKGTALLVAKQYKNTYVLGMHKGQYKALVQYAPVEVYRDANRNEIAEESQVIQRGNFGINIHRANASAISTLVEKWSAGCQVLNNPKEFSQLISMCEKSGVTYFTYTLLNEWL